VANEAVPYAESTTNVSRYPKRLTDLCRDF
jgi:hypothetical protein